MASPPRIALIALLSGLGLGFFTPIWRDRASESRSVAASASQHEVSTALAEFDRLDRVAAVASRLSGIPPEGLDGVLAAFEKAPLNGGDIEYLLLVSWWARFDPEAAHRWARSDMRVGAHRLILEELFRTWARHDPGRALAAVDEMQFPAHRGYAMTAVLLEVDTSDMAGMLELLRTLAPGENRRNAIAALASQGMALTDPEQTKRWIEGLAGMAHETGDIELAKEIRSASVTALAGRDPAAAVEWWRGWRGLEDDLLPRALAEEIALAWTKRDPTAAMAWISTLPADTARDEILRESYREWLVQDFPAAFAWIAPHAQAPERWLEPAVRAHAITIGYKKPLDGLAIAENLSDESIRRETSTSIVRNWLEQDRDAALAWIEAADLPREQEARLLAMAERGAPRKPLRARPPTN